MFAVRKCSAWSSARISSGSEPNWCSPIHCRSLFYYHLSSPWWLQNSRAFLLYRLIAPQPSLAEIWFAILLGIDHWQSSSKKRSFPLHIIKVILASTPPRLLHAPGGPTKLCMKGPRRDKRFCRGSWKKKYVTLCYDYQEPYSNYLFYNSVLEP